MNKIYFDNAANTFLRYEVLEEMNNIIKNNVGNPSANHQFGRKMRFLIEKSRILIANYLNVLPSEIIFTSGGTEANNFILRSCIKYLKIKKIISSKLEHNSVLKTLIDLFNYGIINLEFIKLKKNGIIDLEDLDKKLSKSDDKTLVSLMYANNEIGNILDIENTAKICKKYKSYFHSDCIQGIGYYNLNINKIPIDFISASAHKFYGPPGIGFVFIKKNSGLKSILTGGNQEYGIRAGTENIYGIIGLAKSLELSYNNMDKQKKHIKNIKFYCINNLIKNFKNIKFNGLSGNIKDSIYTILNVSFPIKDELLAFKLDLEGIAVSQGSACIGIRKYSHVIENIFSKKELDKTSNIRISFGIFNSIKEIDILIDSLKKIFFNTKNILK